jgi:hypothetical protein
MIVSIHAPARGATRGFATRSCGVSRFYPRSRAGSDGGRPVVGVAGERVSIHAPARSAARYCARRNSTFPLTGPSTRASNRPWRSSRTRVIPARASAPISGGENGNAAEHHHRTKHVQRKAAAFGAVDLRDEILAILAESRALRRDIKCVEQSLHDGDSPTSPSRTVVSARFR